MIVIVIAIVIVMVIVIMLTAEQRPATSLFLRLNKIRFGYMHVLLVYDIGEE